MANDRMAWTQTDDQFVSSGAMGSFANDAWQIASTFDTSRLPSVIAKRVAVFVQYTITSVGVVGPNAPLTGSIEVALGLDSGLRGLTHRNVEPINTLGNVINPNTGRVRTFVMVQQQSPVINDPDFGSAISTLSGANLCLWTRASWVDDLPGYVCNYRLTDIQWLVFDMDVLETYGMVRAHVATDVTVTSSNAATLVNGDATSPGLNKNHLVFAASYVQQRDDTWAPTATARPLICTAGSASVYDDPTTQTAKVRYGQHSQQTSLIQSSRSSDARMCAGGVFAFYAGNDDFHQTTAVSASPLPPAGKEAIVRYSVLLALTIEELEAQASATGMTINGGVPTAAAPGGFLPTTQTRLVNNTSVNFAIEPIVIMTHGRRLLNGGSGITSYRARVLSDTGGTLYEPLTYHVCGGAEEMQVVSLYTTKIIKGQSRPLRLQPEFDIGSNLLPNQLRANSGIIILFHHTLNVTDVLDPVWSDLTPVELTIAAEGPVVGSMNTLPVQPDLAQQVSTIGMKHGEVLGSQGYRRTWPTWITPRRAYNLQWSSVSAADAATLLAFLDANDSFAYTPPHGTATPVLIDSDVQSYRLPDGREQISVQVVQLVWTA